MCVEDVYTSIACNRTPHAADWGKNSYIAFAASHALAIIDPNYDGDSTKIIRTLVQHKKRVNVVQWLKGADGGKEVFCLTGGDDGIAILWDLNDFDKPNCYHLKGHRSGVIAVSGLQQANGLWLLATGASDSVIFVWKFDGTNAHCIESISMNGGFCFTLKLTQLPNSDKSLLVFGADDGSVGLWVPQCDSNDNVQRDFNSRNAQKLTGHEDWVRGLDVIRDDNEVIIASSSQDHFIRIWRLTAYCIKNMQCIRNNAHEDENELRVKERIFQLFENKWYAVALESVLYGHEGWVYGVHWNKTDENDLRLLSASIDKSLIIWAQNEDGIWMEEVRVGEVGGNSLGFFGGKFSHDGKSIMGHSYQGGFHIWKQSTTEEATWQPAVVVGGHFDEVRDLAWDPKGMFLMTVSADQTTRIHAPWHRTNATNLTWHEIARPQVHGYDMQAIALLSRYKFASGAEEKIVRTFQCPANFIENFRRLCQVTDDKEGDLILASLPKGASVPSLGLSNKAVYNVDEEKNTERHVKDQYPENYFVPVELNTPPQEETLMQNTLWPEVQKLYGHGFEIYALAASPDGAILASACRATTTEHAEIILWNTINWKQIQKLQSHQLTVTQLRFSPNGMYLVSVSRDRRWSLFTREETLVSAVATYRLVATPDKGNGVHTRIIWSCAWSHDSLLFCTTSRDSKVAIWGNEKGDITQMQGWHPVGILELKNESVTACAFGPLPLDGEGVYIIAFGCESGLIYIYRFDSKWLLLLTLYSSQAHHLTVRRLEFRPIKTISQQLTFELASCGDDNITRINRITI